MAPASPDPLQGTDDVRWKQARDILHERVKELVWIVGVEECRERV